MSVLVQSVILNLCSFGQVNQPILLNRKWLHLRCCWKMEFFLALKPSSQTKATLNWYSSRYLWDIRTFALAISSAWSTLLLWSHFLTFSSLYLNAIFSIRSSFKNISFFFSTKLVDFSLWHFVPSDSRM